MKYAFMFIEFLGIIGGAATAVLGDIEGAILLWVVATYMSIQRHSV